MIKLEVNNGGRLELTYKNGWTVVTEYNHKNEVEFVYGIEDHDFVTMLNWFRYQKDNGNEALLFDGIGIGEVQCVQSFVEDSEEYFSNRCYYTIISKDSVGYRIKNNFNGVSMIYTEDFADYFKEV